MYKRQETPVEEKGSSVLGFFKKEAPANTAPEEENSGAKQEKGSLFDFFKRKQPEQGTEEEAVKGEGEAAPAETAANAAEPSETASAPAVESSEMAPAPAAESSETASAPAAESSEVASAPTVESSESSTAPAAESAEITIVTARQAFWSRDFAGATSMYEALIAKDPENPDLYGEFGNMLIQNGKLPQGLDCLLYTSPSPRD